MTEEIRRANDLLHDLEVQERYTDKIEAEWEQEPENEQLEKAFDEAYREQFKTFEMLAEAICDITHGQIDGKTARAMINGKREELRNLLKKIG